MVRNVVHIDEEKCNGCGQCVTACAEGAIQLVDGKARLVSEIYCDGLGACIGECPQGAITVEQRDAEDYDVRATREHLRRIGRDPSAAHDPNAEHGHAHAGEDLPCGCAGSAARAFTPAAQGVCPGSAPRSVAAGAERGRTGQPSALGQWPVQLALVAPNAPYFQGADLLVTADCVPYAYADYHADLLAGKAVVVGCPKLDTAEYYVGKLAAILSASDLKSISVAIMEVPCCRGLVRIVEQALAQSGKDLPFEVVTIGVRGEKQVPVAV
ncbi:MAG: 4Fe-4S binding protein [Armatimonadota bacterium]|nr:MAG: 4Fe-4S binding protein [Armatimonadota bacterium]